MTWRKKKGSRHDKKPARWAINKAKECQPQEDKEERIISSVGMGSRKKKLSWNIKIFAVKKLNFHHLFGR